MYFVFIVFCLFISCPILRSIWLPVWIQLQSGYSSRTIPLLNVFVTVFLNKQAPPSFLPRFAYRRAINLEFNEFSRQTNYSRFRRERLNIWLLVVNNGLLQLKWSTCLTKNIHNVKWQFLRHLLTHTFNRACVRARMCQCVWPLPTKILYLLALPVCWLLLRRKHMKHL